MDMGKPYGNLKLVKPNNQFHFLLKPPGANVENAGGEERLAGGDSPPSEVTPYREWLGSCFFCFASSSETGGDSPPFVK